MKSETAETSALTRLFIRVYFAVTGHIYFHERGAQILGRKAEWAVPRDEFPAHLSEIELWQSVTPIHFTDAYSDEHTHSVAGWEIVVTGTSAKGFGHADRE